MTILTLTTITNHIDLLSKKNRFLSAGQLTRVIGVGKLFEF